jgi:hypothetical protein
MCSVAQSKILRNDTGPALGGPTALEPTVSVILRSIYVRTKPMGIRIPEPEPTRRVRDGLRLLWMSGSVLSFERSAAQQVCQLARGNLNRMPPSSTDYLHLDRRTRLRWRSPAGCQPAREIVLAHVEVILRTTWDAQHDGLQ